MKKLFTLIIIFSFIVVLIIPSFGGTVLERNIPKDNIATISDIKTRGYIQDLIDNTSDGDTIYIPSGTYYENLVIDKSINLIGEDKNTTIIDGRGLEDMDVVYISADWVNISGFTIRNGGKYCEWYAGISLNSNYNTIIGNIITSNNGSGIFSYSSSFNKIINNEITNNHYHGILLASNNIIMGNEIKSNNKGISIIGSNTVVKENIIISNKEIGINLIWCLGTTIAYNILFDNGIGLVESGRNIINNNTISDSENGLSLHGGDWGSSQDNIIANNSFFNSGLIISNYHFASNIVKDNTVNGKPLVYVEDESNIFIEEKSGQTILANCDNVTVINQEISNANRGIQILHTKNCNINGNIISSNNENGITIFSSNNINITNNTISYNKEGIRGSETNSNNLIGNTITNNYDGIIIYSYSYQNIIKNNTISSNKNQGICFDWGVHSNSIISNIITNNHCGIYGGNIAINNTISDNYYGITSVENIIDNIIVKNYYGVCGGHTVLNNTISDNYYGLTSAENIIKNMIVKNQYGIYINRSTSKITNNTISNNIHGVYILESNNNPIRGNCISENKDGIELKDSDNNNIQGNLIISNQNGINLVWFSKNNTIRENTISKNNQGIYFLESWYNTITLNNIIMNTGIGININSSSSNIISKNNIYLNKKSAFFLNCKNVWNQNYWERPRILPKIIFGKFEIGYKTITWINIDWYPALKIYELGV